MWPALNLLWSCVGEMPADPCASVSGATEVRAQACLERLGALTFEIPNAAREVIAGITNDSDVVMVGGRPGTFDGVTRLDQIPADWFTADEASVAEALRDTGVRGLVVDRRLRGALDRGAAVLERLVRHDHLDWFQLRYVSEHAFVYTVRSASAQVPQPVGDALLLGLRTRLEEAPRDTWPDQPWSPASLRIIASLRLQGQALVFSHAYRAGAEGNTDAVLDALVPRLRREWERHAEVAGHGLLDDRLPELRLEIHIVKERAPIRPRSRAALAELWEMGVDGMMFRQRIGPGLDEKFTYMPGSELVTRSLKTPDAFLHFATDTHGWYDRRPWEDRRTRLEIIRDQHFIEASPGGGPAVRLVRGLPQVPLADIDDEAAETMLVAGGEWWLRNMQPDGSITYKYWPAQNRESSEYNEVRHVMVVRDLVDVWRYRKDPRYLAGARRAMDWLVQFEVDSDDAEAGPLPHPPEGTRLFRYPSYDTQDAIGKPANQKLGTVAVALLGWVAWAEASGSHEEDRRIRRLASFVKQMQEPDGRFRAYYVHDEHAYVTVKNDIVPGEAMLALAEVAEYFGEVQWIEGYGAFLDFYRPWFAERASRKNPNGRWPHGIYDNQSRLDLVQFGPWSVMAARKVYQLTGNEEAAAFGLDVADWMIDNYQWTPERTPWPDYLGGYFKMVEELPAMQTFCYAEGTAAAYALAVDFAPERKAKYADSTRQAIRFLDVMQFDETDSYFVPRPQLVRGGIKYTMNENKIRIDYVGHGLSTLSQWLDARRIDPDVHPQHRTAQAAVDEGEVPR